MLDPEQVLGLRVHKNCIDGDMRRNDGKQRGDRRIAGNSWREPAHKRLREVEFDPTEVIIAGSTFGATFSQVGPRKVPHCASLMGQAAQQWIQSHAASHKEPEHG
jgi:hypothetical protein